MGVIHDPSPVACPPVPRLSARHPRYSLDVKESSMKTEVSSAGRLCQPAQRIVGHGAGFCRRRVGPSWAPGFAISWPRPRREDPGKLVAACAR